MCGLPRPPKPVPPPSSVPTTQAADEVALNAQELNQPTPAGRLALSTRPKSSRASSATPATASSVLTAAGATTSAPADQAASGGASASDTLFGGRTPGSRQPFFDAGGGS